MYESQYTSQYTYMSVILHHTPFCPAPLVLFNTYILFCPPSFLPPFLHFSLPSSLPPFLAVYRVLLFVIMGLSQSANDTGIASRSDVDDDNNDDDDDDDVITKQPRISPLLWSSFHDI